MGSAPPRPTRALTAGLENKILALESAGAPAVALHATEYGRDTFLSLVREYSGSSDELRPWLFDDHAEPLSWVHQLGCALDPCKKMFSKEQVFPGVGDIPW